MQEKESFQEIEVIEVDCPLIKNENMKNYNMIEFVTKDNNLYAIPNMGIKRTNNSIFFDVTFAPEEFKEKYKKVIKEIKINGKKETKSFLKTISDKFTKKQQEKDIINVIPINAKSFLSLSQKEKNKLNSLCQFETTTEGLAKKEILMQKQVNPEEPLYYEVTDLMFTDMDIWAKIYQDSIELKKQSNGLYNEVEKINNGPKK